MGECYYLQIIRCLAPCQIPLPNEITLSALLLQLIQQSKFCLIVLDEWDSLTVSAIRSIHAQLWTCFMFHSIPVIPTAFESRIAETYLPFFYLLRPLWTGAIVFQPFTNAEDFVGNLEKITLAERTQRLDKVSKAEFDTQANKRFEARIRIF